MDFEEALAYMGAMLRFGWRLGNERFIELCSRLGDPQNRYPVLHITGTKGKGSTTALAAAILREAGYHVGGYFSPYVYDPCERVQVDGLMIPRADFARLITRIRPHVEAIAQTELGQTTEFEMKTALGFLYFAERQVDVACIEVGLGGRLDATNIVHPEVTVITNIGLDHTEILGETHALIAGEKAGIIKNGIPCITATDHPEALDVIVRTAAERNAPLIRVVPEEIASGDELRAEERACPSVWWHAEGEASPVTIVTAQHRYVDLEMRMGGRYQRANAACAVAAVERLLMDRGEPLPEAAVRRALGVTALPGRFEVIRLPAGPLVVLDGAHNPMAAEALAGPVNALRRQHQIERLLLVVGMVGGHEPEGVLAPFAAQAAHVYACRPNWKRGQAAERIAETARHYTSDVTVIPGVEDAYRAALAAATPRDMVLVTGSFYTVGEIPRLFPPISQHP